MHQRHSKAADVYSFGIVLWELLTWQLPWDDCNHFQVQFSLLAGARILPALQYSIERHCTQPTWCHSHNSLLIQCFLVQPALAAAALAHYRLHIYKS